MGGISAKFGVAVLKASGSRSAKIAVVVLKASMLDWGVEMPVHLPSLV